MRNRFMVLAGVALAIIGGVKAWTHATATSFLILPTCSGQTLNIPVSTSMSWASMHCWGCYVAVLGVSMAVLGLIQSGAAQRLRIRASD